MSSIGPQLPPNISKRKRSSSSSGPQPPPSKATRTAEADSSSDDDGYGPSTATIAGAAAGPVRPPSPPRRAHVGPSVPPGNNDEIALDSDSDSPSDLGPAAPAPRRVVGPTAPPAALSERPPHPPSDGGPSSEEDDDDDDDDDDDGYGPALPTSAQAARRAAAAAALEAEAASRAAAAAPAPTKRDDWMIRPPPPTNKPDPTKLRAKGFATGRAAAAVPGAGAAVPGEIGSLWTETAAQRQERILARPGPSASASASAAAAPRAPAGDGSREAAIRAYTEQTRGRSLYEEHQANRKAGRGGAEEPDDPSKRAFDREKDMAVGGRMTNAKMRDLRKQAADFGGRFSKGSYL